MNIIQKLYHIQLADFRERTRRYSFLITIGVITLLSFFTLPPVNQKGKALRLVLNNEYRAVYNSSFIGSAIVVLVVMILSLFGFYLVKNSIERDYNTGVGQIIATTPTSKVLYLLGKMLSNFFVLAVIVCIIAIVAFILNIIRGETVINLWELFAPFLIIALPSMLLIASISVLFETIPFLRGSFGNIMYFFLWTLLITLDMMNTVNIFGLGSICENISNICPNVGGLSWCYCQEYSIKSILWQGFDWNSLFLIERFVWIIIAICIVLLASAFFDRFDLSKSSKVKQKRSKKNRDNLKIPEENTYNTVKILKSISIKKLTTVPIKFNFWNMVKAELNLILSGLSWWWNLIALGLIAACVFTPIQIAQNFILPFAWLWPIAIWSQMGSIEKRHNMDQIVFSCEHYLQRHLPCIFIAGTIISMIMGSGIALRLIIMNNFMGLLMFILASMLIPALALVLGVLTRNNKLFEILYVIIWYLGPINHIELLNFTHIINPSLSLIKIYFLVDAILFLFILAVMNNN